MNWPCTEEQIFQTYRMLEFLEHSHFTKQAAEFNRRFSGFEQGFLATKNIFEVHFHPTNPMQRIAPGKIHCVLRNPIFAIWKLEMAVADLKSNQWPRVWFAVSGNKIGFLCMGTHVDNYDNNKMDRLAQNLVSDIF